MTSPNPNTLWLEAVPWTPGLVGEFPGHQSYIELSPGGPRMVFGWCPPFADGAVSGFWLAKYPVSQAQWREIMKTEPSRKGIGADYPVDSVSWDDAQEFCKKTALRLPTEKEWEYACLAGTDSNFGIGNGSDANSQLANFDGNYPDGNGPLAFKWLYREATTPGGTFPANDWGFHDMHGQLWEWCEDRRGDGDRALRGGSWLSNGGLARSDSRSGDAPGSRSSIIGFRPCPSSTKTKSGIFGPWRR